MLLTLYQTKYIFCKELEIICYNNVSKQLDT